MNGREYLEQANRLEENIIMKTQQMERIRNLAEKVTSTIEPVVVSRTIDPHRKETLWCKLVDMSKDIQNDVEQLVDVQNSIRLVIASINVEEYAELLRMRHLLNKSWNEIAVEFGCSIRHLRRIRNKAYEEVERIIEAENII